jgi:DNA-binding NarL/FixJ family response regulator
MTADDAPRPIRVVLADDHTIVREGIRGIIEGQPGMLVVGEAADGEQAIAVTTTLAPDVLVVDMSMPGLNGAQVTRRIRRALPGVRVVALTVHDDRAYLSQLLKSGVSGYVLKRAATPELIQAIRTVAGGGVYLDPRVAGHVVNGFVGDAIEPSRGTPEVLSERETQVLRQIARGFSNKEVAAQLAISVKTVETYKTRIMEKLGLRGRADIVKYALRCGWLEDGA